MARSVSPMAPQTKLRIGFALGAAAAGDLDGFGRLIDDLDTFGFDSVWLPESFGQVPGAPSIDPVVGLAFAAARVRRLKLGTHFVLPDRNLVRTARQLAQLDRLSGGRLLLTMVNGLDHPIERRAQGLPKGDRGAAMDEALPALRRLWAGETVTVEGRFVQLDDARCDVLPRQQPLEMWLGGTADGALRRCGRVGDGWLPGLTSIAEAVRGRAVVEAAAADAGRSLSPEHFGINLAYCHGALPEAVLATYEARRPGFDPSDVVTDGLARLRDLITRWYEAGFSKFVLRPVLPPTDWSAELEALGTAVLDLQT